MAWMITMAAMLGSMAASAQAPAPVEVMVVGTYHFDNPGKDLNNPQADNVLKPQRQRELQALSEALAGFKPTKIMVERVAKTSDLIDPRFRKFTPADLRKDRDERAQIAYRLAHRLGHQNVYAIDEQPEDGEPDYFPFGKLVAWAKANGAQGQLDGMLAAGKAMAAGIEKLQSSHTIGGALAVLNARESIERDQTIYYRMLGFGDTTDQPGADLNAMWYLRNAKIFAKLMRVASPGDRVLVVYGNGHNYWLRHFAAAMPHYREADPVPYLRKASAAGF